MDIRFACLIHVSWVPGLPMCCCWVCLFVVVVFFGGFDKLILCTGGCWCIASIVSGFQQSYSYGLKSCLFWLVWKMWVYVMISVGPASQHNTKPLSLIFSHHECDKCQQLHDCPFTFTCSYHFSDLDHISDSQQCQTVLTEKLCAYLIKLKLCRIIKYVM